ncbi:MAG: glycerol-3-phosphate dehydrogenase/oxidase [Deltaproteobacteria bacterium]|nr:glycerol-3-phosphate dehydrogenase/oxidase [Deltaproteobacteria bacterium]
MTNEKQENFYDLVITGGGITGAGIVREAIRMGIRVLLVEKNDFAWGTSSKSSKLVHGGLRYLKEGRIHLTWESVREREKLISQAPGLVDPIDFTMPIISGRGPGRAAMTAGLSLYDLMAGQVAHTYHKKDIFSGMVPHMSTQNLKGGFRFMDAQTDDARLVQRLINEAVDEGAEALNYTAVTEIKRNANGSVTGVVLEDSETGDQRNINCSAVINATGSWAESLHSSPKKGLHLRPLRGSHIVIPIQRLPISQAITLMHPDDHRPLFVIPWEGAIILGTTDIDHGSDISKEAVMSKQEGEYMMGSLNAYFPSAQLKLSDCISSFAGIRPVLSKGDLDPSKESREHVVWIDKGLVTVTGGKMTTFRVLALDALKAARPWLPSGAGIQTKLPAFNPAPPKPHASSHLLSGIIRRLYGRYGLRAGGLIDKAEPKDLTLIPGSMTLWAELPVLAKTEQVRHLSDLLLRRVRAGLILPNGGSDCLDRVQALCEPHLSWDTEKWKTERQEYIDHWQWAHRPVR